MGETIRIILADDHSIVRHGLKQLMGMTTDLQVVGEASNGQQVLGLLPGGCDLLLLDLSMPNLSGVELIRRIAAREDAPRVLVLSMHNEAQLVSRAIKAGAAGYLTKDSDPETLIAAIRKVARGGRYIDPALVDTMVFDHGLGDDKPPHERLSDREFQIFQLLVSGDSVNNIAARLSLSAKTISTHKLRLLQKMQMSSIAELTRYALEHQLIPH
ncbi:response regulator transcription factor [Massilia solisilvae]|uniref:Response regulator transcription factor n=1 Tax=Massilia solisilvae TaxID=1811225 RepID=A0ABT2BES3_9BURK|nr:response regulator transcription factor [Massilia solisilvae]MCS0607016.1 response regulator transcription factor [Massilia solisilvae]